jgi:hypothetical protein
MPESTLSPVRNFFGFGLWFKPEPETFSGIKHAIPIPIHMANLNLSSKKPTLKVQEDFSKT